MKNARNLAILVACLTCLWITGCTPPPPKEVSDTPPPVETDTPEETEVETITDSNGETATPSEDGTLTQDGISYTEVDDPDLEDDEAGVHEEDGSEGDEDVDENTAEEETDEETAIDEPMSDTRNVPENMFGGYESWPPDSINEEDIAILRDVVCVLETTKGIIKIRLFPDQAPLHSANFVKLIQDGYYDGLLFHRVIDQFMSQGGDPTGTGSGGPGYQVPAEIGLPHLAGRLAAARQGDRGNPQRRSSGSQFYLCRTTERTSGLDGDYTVYGEIIDGQDVNLALNLTEGPGAASEPDSIIRAWVEMAG